MRTEDAVHQGLHTESSPSAPAPRRNGLLLALATVGTIGGLLCALNPGLMYVDEEPHMRIALGFCEGNFDTSRVSLPMWPGYHVLLMIALSATGQGDPRSGLDTRHSLLVGRLVTAFLGALSVLMFYRCSRALGRESRVGVSRSALGPAASQTIADGSPEERKTAQPPSYRDAAPALRTLEYLWCPLIVPYFALVFTDVPSLAFLLTAFYSTLRGKYGSAAIFSAFAIAIRQSNVLWTLFFVLFAWRRGRARIAALWPLLAVILAVIAVAVSRHGLIFNQRALELNPAGVYFNNALLLPFYFFVLLWPMWRLDKPFSWTLVAALLCGWLPFNAWFHVQSPLNELHGYAVNDMLRVFCGSIAWKLLLYLCVCGGTLLIGRLRLLPGTALPLFGISVLSMLPLVEIQARYDMAPVTFALLLLDDARPAAHRALVAWFLLLSAGVVWLMVYGNEFPA